MKLINIIFLFIIINKIACLSRALYLGKSKCFYDNYYQQMNIVITYKVLDENIKLTKGNKMLFQISLMSMEKDDYKVFYGSKLTGKFSYNIEENDKYRICIESHDKDLFINKQFLRIEFKIQQSDELYDEHSAKAKDFQKVNFTMQNLNSKVDSIDIMQNFQLEIEDAFSKNQIKSSSRLAFLTVCQIIIICIVGIYHVFSLRKIFKDKIWAPF